MQDKSSDINISIPANDSTADSTETNQNNKENQVENNVAAVDLDDEDTSEDEELDILEQAMKGPDIDVVISDDEELR